MKEEEESECLDGTFNKERYFTCPVGRGFFGLLEDCRPDFRFANSPTTDVSLNAEKGKQARLNNTNEMCTAKTQKNNKKLGPLPLGLTRPVHFSKLFK